MSDLSNIHIIGRIANPEELKTIGQETKVLRFSVAVNVGWGDKKKTVWYRCSMFGKQAVSLQQYIIKGKPIMVIGEHSNSEWTSKDGVLKYSNEIRVEKIVLLGSKDDHQERQEAPAEEQASDDPAEKSLPGTDDGSVPF